MDVRVFQKRQVERADPGAEAVVPAAGRHFEDPGLTALTLLPLVLLALDPDWMFSGPHRDAWIYYGYFENGIAYLARFQDVYYSSRLGAILPGFVLQHLLPPIAANVVLHLAVYWSAVLSFYLVIKDLIGLRVALVAGLALGCHPYFIQAAGWNYVDGFGIAYFLAALLLLTRAAESPAWRPLLLGAGALGMALVSTNVFYGIYLPLLAGCFAVLNRRRGRIPLAAAALWTGAGAAGLLLLFGAFSWIAGGRFFYLHTSLQFLAGSIGTKNPFRDATYAWIIKAVWLVFPLVTVLGAAILLWRARTDPALRQDRVVIWFQAQFVLLVLLMLYFQVFGDTAVLQHFYYSSLLIPVAFLAFAGQVAPLVERLPGRRFTILVAAAALLQIAPMAVPRISALSYRNAPFSSPAFLALLTGLGTLAAVWRRKPGERAALAVFLCLAASQFLVRQGGTIFAPVDRDGLYSQISRAVASIDRFDPSRELRLWYHQEEADGGVVYDAVASAFLLCPRMINLSFPDVTHGIMCDGSPLAAGVTVAILSADPSAFAKADAALHGIGLSAVLLKREEIPGPSPGFTITYIRSAAGAAP